MIGVELCPHGRARIMGGDISAEASPVAFAGPDSSLRHVGEMWAHSPLRVNWFMHYLPLALD